MSDDKNKGELIAATESMKVFEFKGDGALNLMKALQNAGLPINMEPPEPQEEDDGRPWNLRELTESFGSYIDEGVDRFLGAMLDRGSTDVDIYNALHIALAHHTGMIEASIDKLRELRGMPRVSIEPQRERQLELGREHSRFHIKSPKADCPENSFGFESKNEV